jgi:hypothetical protein
LKERAFCNEDPCEVDGEWTNWSKWSDCSVSCGGGIRRRSRGCSDPRPANGGDECDGVPQEVEACLTNPCPGDENKECGENKFWSKSCDGPFTCYDYADADALVAEDGCNEGCRCAAGYVMDNTGECVVPAKECGCYDPVTGRELYEGQTTRRRPEDPCEECTCEKAELKCKDVPCNRDCDYTEWSDWSDCSNIMGGEIKRYRAPNNPEARGSGKACDEEELIQIKPCGDETCQHCMVDGVQYAVSEIISYEACKKKCFCNSDGEMQCESAEETCEECPKGYELSPEALDCCKCVPVEKEQCSLEKRFEKVEVDYPVGAGSVKCISEKEVEVTTCSGFCASMDFASISVNGENLGPEKDCKCCTGEIDSTVDVELSCTDQKTRTVQMAKLKACNCNQCSGGSEEEPAK